MKNRLGKAILIGVPSVWAAAVVGGLAWMAHYNGVPGKAGHLAPRIPHESRLSLPASGRFALVIFLHPKCPCSRASVAELDTLMARTGGRAHAYAIFVQPEGWTEEEAKGSLWNQAAAIPGVEVKLDPGGREARRLGALTSGQLLAYAPDGRLAFAGGITPSRGHSGDSLGLQAAITLVRTGQAPIPKSRVFGCALFASSSRTDGESHGKPRG